MDDEQRKRFNVWPLAGALLGILGLVTYFTVFAAVPALRDSAALNLLLVALGAVAGLCGAVVAVRRRRLLGIAGAALGLLVAGACAALLGLYVFSLSSSLPAPSATTAALEAAPDFTLTAHDGSQVTLSSFRGRRVLLVFYRGWW